MSQCCISVEIFNININNKNSSCSNSSFFSLNFFFNLFYLLLFFFPPNNLNNNNKIIVDYRIAIDSKKLKSHLFCINIIPGIIRRLLMYFN